MLRLVGLGSCVREQIAGGTTVTRQHPEMKLKFLQQSSSTSRVLLFSAIKRIAKVGGGRKYPSDRRSEVEALVNRRLGQHHVFQLVCSRELDPPEL
jgi:hypothetical protein